MRIGYTTGTFDGIHLAHVNFLKLCHNLLDGGLLIVGLTTDELAVRQKRATTHNYDSRCLVLQELPYVDHVTAHRGEPKREMIEKLHLTDIFIGDEYYLHPEYEDVADMVQLHYLPSSHPLIHCKHVAQLQAWKTVQAIQIEHAGVAGVLYKVNTSFPYIIKNVHLTQLEYTTHSTANVYHLPTPPPRNYKKLHAIHDQPFLPGINGWREIQIQPLLPEWCTTIEVKQTYVHGDTTIHKPLADWAHIRLDKSFPAAIYSIYQHYIGPTLHDWIQRTQSEPHFVQQLKQYLQQVKDCILQLHKLCIVHGDVHPHNVVVADRTALIDFGWCMHESFDMDDEERADYEEKLESNWDEQHFRDSMEYLYHTEPWFPSLVY
jgi:cytidyltransferase-like protein